MDLIKTVNDEHLKFIIESELTNVEEKIKEWRDISKQQAVFAAVVKMMGKRITELEAELLPFAKEMESQQAVIDTAIVAYKTKSSTSVKYKEGFTKALEISNKKQREILNEFIGTVTTKGTKEQIEIADPDLEEFLVKLGEVSPEELADKLGDVSKLPRNIVNKKKREGDLQEDMVDIAASAVKKLVSIFKVSLNRLKSKFKSSQKAAETLLATAKAE